MVRTTPDRGAPLLLRGAALFDGVTRELDLDLEVRVQEGRIAAVEPRGSGPSADGVTVVDLEGVLIPGLIDIHAHCEDREDQAAALAAGVTTLRNAASVKGPDSARQRTGALLPDVVTAGPIIDAPPARFENTQTVTTEAEAREVVRAQADLGVVYVKLYSQLPPALVLAAVDEAHRLGLQAIGDLGATSWVEAARAGIDFIAHAVPMSERLLPAGRRASFVAELAARKDHPWLLWLEHADLDSPEIAEMIEVLASHDVALEATLVTIEAALLHREPAYRRALLLGTTLRRFDEELASDSRELAAWSKTLELVGRLHQGGVRILAGTDAPRRFVPPGLSLHRELLLLESAGMTPNESLCSATSATARALGFGDGRGIIAKGACADLVLLNRDPIESLANVSTIEWVMKSGLRRTPHQIMAQPQGGSEAVAP